jgi:nitrite reductase (NADH) large subunit
VGLSYIKRRVVEDAPGRKALHQRFLASQVLAQVDPWKERAAGVQAHEFEPLAEVAP